MFEIPTPWRAPGGVLAPVAADLDECVRKVLRRRRHGHLDRWMDLIHGLPEIPTRRLDFCSDRVTIGAPGECSGEQAQALRDALMQLHPWRKGPFNLFGIEVDAEWRSDLKWRRVADAIQPLAGRVVLDVGCGNGYYLFRMLGAGARCVLGIDPSQLFCAQFNALRRYCPGVAAHVLPLRCEELPFAGLARRGPAFDTVFSMGVLYHRRRAREHLGELYGLLAPGGQLVLETLVLEHGADDVLVPETTYAKMPNVYGVPGIPRLQDELARAGFVDALPVNVSRTGVDEQRGTPWMTFQSLADFLDPADPARTVEGYPAPVRSVITATRP